MLRALGFDPNQEEILKLIKEFDNNKENIKEEKRESWQIDFERFLKIIIYKMDERDTEDNIIKVLIIM